MPGKSLEIKKLSLEIANISRDGGRKLQVEGRHLQKFAGSTPPPMGLLSALGGFSKAGGGGQIDGDFVMNRGISGAGKMLFCSHAVQDLF